MRNVFRQVADVRTRPLTGGGITGKRLITNLVAVLACGIMVLVAPACSKAPAPVLVPAAVTEPGLRVTPNSGGLDARTLAVYRTVADSVYVRTTQRTVAVLTAPLDTTCAAPMVGSQLAGLPCAPLAERWAIDGLRWDGADAAETASVRRSWLANSGRKIDLHAVPAGWPYLVPIEPSDAPTVSSDLQDWASFRDANGYAVGAVRFSSVGFGASGKTALVAVEWRCGPTCGHTLSAALIATSDSTWRIDNMVLISSMQR